MDSETSTSPTSIDSQFLHYGDIIQIFTRSPSEPASEKTRTLDINERTFLVDYVDDDKIRIVDTTSFDTLLLHLDDEGRLEDPSILRIDLLTRAKEPGYARQKGLVPGQWVDIFFIGMESPITGKITHLEEDQIELTLHPSKDMVYIDFSYRGLPENLNVEKFVLRSAPSGAWTTEEAEEVEEKEEVEGVEEKEGVEEATSAVSTPSMEYTADNEVILSLPEIIEYDRSIDEVLQEQYLEADELFFGKDRDVVEQYVEQEQYEMVFSIDTQMTSLMNELLSRVPNAQRTHDVMNGVHRLLDRFKELREQFSLIDATTHQIQGVRLRGSRYKPLVEHLVSDQACPLSWLMPVTQTRRNMYFLPDEQASNFDEVGDTVLLPLDLDKLTTAANDYKNDVLHGLVNPYYRWLEQLDPYFHPVVNTPLTITNSDVPRKSILYSQTVSNNRWESLLDHAVNRFEFSATTAVAHKKSTTLDPSRFVTQHFCDAPVYLTRSEDNRRVFLPQRTGKGETMAIQSWVAFPWAVAWFSKIHLPQMNMLHRASLAQNYLVKSLAFPSHVDSFVIDDLRADYFSTEKAGQGAASGGPGPSAGQLSKNYMKGLQHYVLDPALTETSSEDTETYRMYLNAFLPNTFHLVELVQSSWDIYHGMSVGDYLQSLEPFMVYMDGIIQPVYNRIRYFISQRSKKYKEHFHVRKDQYQKLAFTYDRLAAATKQGDLLARKLLDQGVLYEIFADAYRPSGALTVGMETLHHVTSKDQGRLFALLMRNVTLHHVVSESFLKAVEDTTPLDDAPGTTRNTCQRHFLAKRYTSLADLQKDNFRPDVYYDKEFDDTPYDLLKPYQAEMPTKEAADSPAMQDFIDLLSVNLTKKHGIRDAAAEELATTLVTKKKIVKEGEYALLDLDAFNREFYKRIKNKWVRDASVQEESFAYLSYLVDAAFPTARNKSTMTPKQVNQQLCDKQPTCYKNPRTATCDPLDDAEHRISQMRKTYAVQEMEARLDLSQEELSKQIEDMILSASRTLVAKERLRSVLEQKYSLLAHAMGLQYAKEQDTPRVQSPFAKLRDNILGQDDFSKKQYDLVRFYQSGALRQAMVEELGEDGHWLYCTQTNTKLLPAFFHDLAKEYVTRGESGYQTRLQELLQFQMLSDDGDAIVDKHSGYVLSNIEWVNEELYDEHGFRIKTASALMTEATDAYEQAGTASAAAGTNPWGTTVPGALSSEMVDTDTETHQMVKNIFATFCQALELPTGEQETGGFRTFVLKTTLELIDVLVKSKEDFMREQAAKSSGDVATKGLAAKYKTYTHQYVIVLTTAVFLIGIQTTIPAIRTKKSIPGCVKSFTGFPLTESMEDQTGIQYLTCMLNVIKSSISPWNSIKGIKKEAIAEMVRKTLERILDVRKDIYDLYLQQRKYRTDHPEEFAIPEPYRLQAWTGLQPPMVRIGILDKLPSQRPVATDRAAAESYTLRYGYGMIETIYNVVRSKELLLKTAVGVPYVQNACCHDMDSRGTTTLQYFMRESALLTGYLGNLAHYQRQLDQWRRRQRANTFVFTDESRQSRVQVTAGHAETLIFAAFIHFCHFDRPDVEIPGHLTSVCAAKPSPESFPVRGTLAEKIQALKNAGKKYSWEDFEQLLRRVNQSRRVSADVRMTSPTAVQVLTEFLATSLTAPTAVAAASTLDVLREPLLAVLVKYDPQIMVLEQPKEAVEPGSMHAVLRDLLNVLAPHNEMLKERVEQFVPKGSQRQLVSRILTQWVDWRTKTDAAVLYDTAQFLKNMVVFLVKILPTMLSNNQFYKEWQVPSHWEMGAKHQEIIVTFLNKNREWFAKFAESDAAFQEVVQEWQTSLLEVVQLAQMLPIQLSMTKNGETYFRLFTTEVTQELLKFVAYTVFDRLVQLAQRLPKTVGGGKTRQRVTQWMMAMLEMLHSDQKVVDMSYQDIMKEVGKSRTKEKARIMKSFQDASDSDRRYMYMEKVFKLNRWSVKTKDLLRENDVQFEKEVAEFVDETLDERFDDVAEGREGLEVEEEEDDDDVHDEDKDDNEGDEDEYDEEDREMYQYDNEDAYGF